MKDEKLLQICLDDDTANYGFNLLVRKYQEQVYQHIRRILIVHDDTDDAVQETFIKVWKNISKFRSDAKLYTWIYRIATNEALQILKKRKRKFFLPIVDYEEQLAHTLEQDEALSGNQIQLKLQKAILTLPEKQRLVFNLKYFEEMKYTDMSEILGTSEGALKASYHIAVKKIEEILKSN